MSENVYEGVAGTLELALERAHSKIPPRPHRDFAVSKIVESGMQRGGVTNKKLFYVKVVEDVDADFKTEG